MKTLQLTSTTFFAFYTFAREPKSQVEIVIGAG
jgi:hypothetical protein